MIAVRNGPDLCMAVVGSPSYFEKARKPERPEYLTNHPCINMRLPTHGAIYVWFEKRGKALKVRVDGQLISNTVALRLNAARAGFGLAYLPEDLVKADVAQGRLIRVPEDWRPPFPGYHLYFPSRRQPTPAFAVLIDALRLRTQRSTSGQRRTVRTMS
jgi:DNA-binding transcriptional LysR family regulator